MIPKELTRKVRQIQIISTKAANDMLAGEYRSAFKGRGMAFDEVREYQPGDEVRAIDWNVTARTGRPFIKRYIEERELTLFFLVDLSASGAFGSVEKTKSQVAAEICALLAFSALKNNDKVGLIVFTDHVELYIPPKKGSSHVLRIVRDLLYFQPSETGTDIASALEYLGHLHVKRSVVFLLSDFQVDGYDREMRTINRRHDLIAISVTDPREMELPKVGMVELWDVEQQRRRIVDTRSKRVRRRYEEAAQSRQNELTQRLESMNVDHIAIDTRGSFVPKLVEFFRARERRQTSEVAR